MTAPLSSRLAPLRRALGRPPQQPALFQSTAASWNDDGSLPTTPPSRRRRPIYVSATRQHVGKTSTSLALLSGLQKRLDKVGFMKPVGQKSLSVTDPLDSTCVWQVDKDAVLVKEHFGLDHITYPDMNPVLIPPGYTKNYLDGKITNAYQRDRVQSAYARVAATSDVVLCEGTGHCAVGSVVEASNAQVASWINARMVLVANGGIGKTLDELEINKVFCDKYNVEVCGVIVNMVRPDKYKQIQHYLEKTLQSRWGVPLLGLIPDRPFLGCPAVADLERLFAGATLVSGAQHRLRHYTVQDLQLVATSLEVFLKNLRRDPGRTLYVSHASRNDILLGFLMESQQRGKTWEAAMVVTGCGEYPISRQVMEIVTSMAADAPPVLMVPTATHQVMEAIHSYTPKLNFEDAGRVGVAVEHYEPYINFDLLLSEPDGASMTETTKEEEVGAVGGNRSKERTV